MASKALRIYSKRGKRVLWLFYQLEQVSKTITFTKITQYAVAKGSSITIIVHRDRLLQQTSKTLFGFGINHSLIAKGSKVYNTKVQVAMVQTLANRLTTWNKTDIIIIDEAHRSLASTYKKIFDHNGNSLLMGFTATPCRLDGKPLGDVFEGMHVGPQTSEMIAMGHLCKFVLYRGSKPDTSKVRISGKDFNQKELSVATDTKALIGDLVQHYTDIAPGKKAVVFCVSVKHADHVAEQFCNSGYKFKALHGGVNKAEQDKILEELETGAIDGITSCEIVSEGFDIPTIEVGILARKTLSLSLYLQWVGRVLRNAPGKKCAIILDHGGNYWTHGAPDLHRDWSLDTPVRVTRKTQSDQEAWRECPKCFGYIPMNETTCPQCGAEYVRKEIEMIQTIAGKLELATEEDFHEKLQKVERLKWLQSIGFDKMTDTQIREFGKLKGYRPGWAYLKIKGRKKGVAV
jgi:superfamily II DNA or RNA helicase